MESVTSKTLVDLLSTKQSYSVIVDILKAKPALSSDPSVMKALLGSFSPLLEEKELEQFLAALCNILINSPTHVKFVIRQESICGLIDYNLKGKNKLLSPLSAFIASFFPPEHDIFSKNSVSIINCLECWSKTETNSKIQAKIIERLNVVKP